MATVHDGMLLVATANGHLDVVKWLHCEQGVILTTDAMREAAQNGYLDIVEWLYETSNGITAAIDKAARYGHLKVVQWLHAHCTEGCTTNAMDKAAEAGHLDVVKLLEIRDDTRDCQQHFDVVIFLHLHGNEGFLLPVYKTMRLPLELQQWLVANYTDEVSECNFEVPKLDWHSSSNSLPALHVSYYDFTCEIRSTFEPTNRVFQPISGFLCMLKLLATAFVDLPHRSQDASRVSGAHQHPRRHQVLPAIPHVVNRVNDFLNGFSVDCTLLMPTNERVDAIRCCTRRSSRDKRTLPALAVQCCHGDGGGGHWCNTEMCGALMSNHVEVVKWPRMHGVPRTECMADVINAAARDGNLDIVKWLHEVHKARI
ncbi:Ankyrin repeat-containing domain [Phytophthora cactorum]|nr:Ankyrin repeat-containing domain [Phytophthora cactorum]